MTLLEVVEDWHGHRHRRRHRPVAQESKPRETSCFNATRRLSRGVAVRDPVAGLGPTGLDSSARAVPLLGTTKYEQLGRQIREPFIT